MEVTVEVVTTINERILLMTIEQSKKLVDRNVAEATELGQQMIEELRAVLHDPLAL